MHLLPGVAIQPNLELKTRPKQLQGSLLLVIALPDYGKTIFIIQTPILPLEKITLHSKKGSDP
jgi:hypothetical protein